MPDDSWWLDDRDLDDDQGEIISLPPDGSYLILGPPGSGKTNLILLRAAYLSRSQRPNVKVLMFGRSLREFASIGAPYYNLDPSKIETISKWGFDFLREHDQGTDDLPTGFVECRREVATRIDSVISAKPLLRDSIECILVDEVQDCLKEELTLFQSISKYVCYAGDSRQRIYQVDDTISEIESRVDRKITLKYHYRIGTKICMVADAIGRTSGEEPILPTCNYDEQQNPSDVEFVESSDAAGQVQEIIARLSRELDAYPGELLGVACPLKDDSEFVRNELLGSSLGSLVFQDRAISGESGDRRVFVSTLHDIKGLEFRTVHLSFMEKISRLRESQKRIAYTAVTRAKTLLTIHHADSLPGYLQQARDSVAAPLPLPDPKSIFPGRD